MKARYLTAATLAAVIAVAGCSSSKSTKTSTPSGSAPAAASTTAAAASASAPAGGSGTLTVWLQTDAQTGWPKEVAAAQTAFNAKYPNVKVDVQYQTWADHLTKLDAALAATPPDVAELGNTETTKYMADGALADISADKAKFDNSATWLKGLADSVTYNGKTFGVPYYAGARGVIYSTDAFTKAGITAPPDDARRAAGRRRQAQGRDPLDAVGFVLAWQGVVRRDVVRLRLRRRHRFEQWWQVDRRPRAAERGRRPDRTQDAVHRFEQGAGRHRRVEAGLRDGAGPSRDDVRQRLGRGFGERSEDR